MTSARRADVHGQYWFIGSDLKIHPEIDTHDEVDNSRFEAGNYFSTRTEAAKTARWIYAGIEYIRGGRMDVAIERWLEARRIVENVGALRRKP